MDGAGGGSADGDAILTVGQRRPREAEIEPHGEDARGDAGERRGRKRVEDVVRAAEAAATGLDQLVVAAGERVDGVDALAEDNVDPPREPVGAARSDLNGERGDDGRRRGVE